ncbi:hypothetical protein LCGC14_3136450, partial [marine sediment metagenome]
MPPSTPIITNLTNSDDNYGPNTWPGSISGTAADALSGLGTTEVYIKKAGTTLYWDGSTYANSPVSPIYNTATGTINWSYAITLGSSGSYEVGVRTNDTAGNTSTVVTDTFTYDEADPAAAGGIYINSNIEGNDKYYTNNNLVSVVVVGPDDPLAYSLLSNNGSSYNGSTYPEATP